MKRAFLKIRRAFQKFFAYIWKISKGNWYLKLAALLFAFLMWSYVIADQNPTRPVTVKGVTVSFSGLNELTEKGLTVDRSQLEKLVDITFSAGINYHKNINNNNTKATVDLSSINNVGEYKLDIQVSASVASAVVRSMSESTVTVYIDELVERTVPVRCEVTGGAAEGYYLEEPVLSETMVVISGAREKIQNVVEAVVVIPSKDMRESVKASFIVTLYDAEGKEVEHEAVNGSVPSVIVELNVRRAKTVGIDLEEALSAITNIKDGYEAVNITVSPETFQIVGEKEILDEITALQIKPISAENADKSVLLEGEILNVAGVEIVGETKVAIYVQIREKESEKTFENIKIEATNLEAGLRVQLSKAHTDVTLTGNQSGIGSVVRKNVIAYVDLAGLRKGTYVLPVKIESISGVTLSKVAIEYTTVTVTID